MSELNKILETDCYKNYLKDIDYLNKVLDKYKTIDIKKSSNYIYELFYFNKKFHQLLSKDDLDPLLRENLEGVTNNLKVVLDSLDEDTLREIYKNHESAIPISKLEKEKYKESIYKGEVKEIIKEEPVKSYLKKSSWKLFFWLLCFSLIFFLNSNTFDSFINQLPASPYIQIFKMIVIGFLFILVSFIGIFSCIDIFFINFPFMRNELYYNSQREEDDKSMNLVSASAVQSVEEEENGVVVRKYVSNKIKRSRNLVISIKQYVDENNLDLSINKKADSLNDIINRCVRKNKNYYDLYESCAKIELLYELLINGDYDS